MEPIIAAAATDQRLGNPREERLLIGVTGLPNQEQHPRPRACSRREALLFATILEA